MPCFLLKNFIGIITVFFLPISLITISCNKNNNESAWEKITITKTFDGDTFSLPSSEKIRLFGIDTPELHNQFNHFLPTKGLEYIYASSAKDFLDKVISDTKKENIKIKRVTKDLYGRTVAKVTFDDQDIGQALVRNGLARLAFMSLDRKSPFYTNDFEYYRKILDFQYLAWRDKKGFWKNEDKFKEIFPKA